MLPKEVKRMVSTNQTSMALTNFKPPQASSSSLNYYYAAFIECRLEGPCMC